MSTDTILWITLIAVVVVLFLLFFRRNRKDRQELEETIKQDYEKPRPHWDEDDLS